MPGSLEPLDLGVQIPYHFRCPISLELMRDPVTVSTGQTYDRLSIESWVATGNDTCPVTRSPLTDFTLIPNHTLRRLIQDWCVQNRSFGVERIPTPKQPADSPTVRALISQSSAGNLAALRRLRSLARDSEKNRNLISSLGARSVLLSLAFSSGSGSESEIQLEALSMAVTLPKFSEQECLSIAEDPEKIEYLSGVLCGGSPEARLSAGAMIEIAISGTRDADVRAAVAGAPGVIPGVLEILRRHKEFELEFGGRAARVGVRAIFAMCVARRAREIVAEAGAAAVLVEKLGEFERAEAERALAAVELLCRTGAGVGELAGGRCGAAAALVKVMMRVSERATEYAAGALLALCTAAEGCRREAAAAGAVTQLLLLVQSDCTERAKRKAQTLLKLLRDSWPIDCFLNDSHDFACSEVVLLPFSYT